MFKEFREFIMRGNVLDLAVGVIIGAAFTTIVTSLVTDILNPIIGLVTGGLDFSDVTLTLLPGDATPSGEPLTLMVGNFISAVINFLIVAFVIFMIVRAFNRIMAAAEKEKEEAAAVTGPTTEEKLVEAIEKLNAHLDEQSRGKTLA